MNEVFYGFLITGLPVLLFWVSLLNETEFNRGERLLATTMVSSLILLCIFLTNDPGFVMSC
jgi:hypothetical protein